MNESEGSHMLFEFAHLVDNAVGKRDKLESVLRLQDMIIEIRYPDALKRLEAAVWQNAGQGKLVRKEKV